MLHAEYSQKTLYAIGEIDIFTGLGRFRMRVLWREFEWKMPIFCPRSQFLASSSHAAAIFSNRT
jgi:hypothetical protein